MPEYYSYAEAREALRQARLNLKDVRKRYGKDSDEAKQALAACVAIQTVLDKMWPGRK
jgi:hypothetical protein